MPIRARATLLLVALLVTVVPVAGRTAAPLPLCAVAEAPLAGSPRAAEPGVPQPVRVDPDGSETIRLFVDDPADAPSSYAYTVVATVEENGVPTQTGVFSHPWPGSPNLVTYGSYALRAGIVRRVPLLVVENGPSADLVEAALARAADESALTRSLLPFALNTVFPSSPLLGDADFNNTAYPGDAGFVQRPPMYVWTAYRSALGEQAWSGVVATHDARFDGDGANRLGCRRTRILLATRTNAGTTAVGGVFLTEMVRGANAPSSYEAEHVLVAGAATVAGDVPLVALHQRERKSGESITVRASEQHDEITLGAMANGAFVPLAGTRSHARHGAPPNAQEHLVSVGAFDTGGAYRPLAGYRTHAKNMNAEEWPLAFAQSGGPGSQTAGDLAIDAGTFDLGGAFVPVAGARYLESFEGAQYPYRMMTSAGPWVGGAYLPVVATTYDGEIPLLDWVDAMDANQPERLGRWMISAGTFAPGGGYAPVAGATFAPGSTVAAPVVEEYRVGAFTGAYPAFVPLAGARWSSDRTSLSWARDYRVAGGRVPSDARVDAGAADGNGGIVDVLGASLLQGRPERYQLGAWIAGGFVPLVEACYAPDRNGHAAVGVAAGGGSNRMPVGWAGTYNGAPAAGTGDCPKR